MFALATFCLQCARGALDAERLVALHYHKKERELHASRVNVGVACVVPFTPACMSHVLVVSLIGTHLSTPLFGCCLVTFQSC